VHVIIYAFISTTSGHFSKSMINMIKDKVTMRSTDKVCRQTSSSTHDLADLRLHLYESNALFINSSEEDNSSKMFISGSNSEDLDIIDQICGFC
jgi:hypothetical protein